MLACNDHKLQVLLNLTSTKRILHWILVSHEGEMFRSKVDLSLKIRLFVSKNSNGRRLAKSDNEETLKYRRHLNGSEVLEPSQIWA